MRRLLALAFLALFVPGLPAQDQEARLLRFPAIHGKTVVFTYAGDLYSAPVDGSAVARKLTTHNGFEMFARFSPDGRTIAFTAQYDGNTEVYTIPATGGVPRRLTYTATLGRDEISDRMGPNNVVMTWTPDGKNIVFRSRMWTFNDFIGRLFSVPAEGGLPTPLPLPRGGFCSYSPDGSKLAYNKVFREFRTWKRYRGGMADEVWVHDFASKQTDRITKNDAQDIFPMWHGSGIYFISDQDEPYRFNLYRYDTGTKETKKLTNYTEFDIKFPSLGNDAIVYEYGGWIYRFDLASGQAEKLKIRLADDAVGGRGGWVDVSKRVTNVELSPDGKRALFGARGDVFTVPAKSGITRNLTQTPGVHERDATWSPDGKWIAFISDKTGEDELWAVNPLGGEPIQLTTEGDNYKYAPLWSPDSKKLAWSDRKQRLRILDVDARKVTEVAQSPVFELRDFSWSPDSQWLVFSQPTPNGYSKITLFGLADGKLTDVTDAWYDASSPVFSGDGKYLFFTSRRDFNPTYSQTEWNHSYGNMTRVYALTLAKATANPFAPKNDEAEVKKDEPKKDDKKEGDAKDDKAEKKEEKKEEKKPEDKKVVIDLDGMAGRVLGLPISPSNYFGLKSVGAAVYYVRGGPGQPPTLCVFDLGQPNPKETVLGRVNGYDISADGKKMIVSRDGSYSILDLPKAPLPEKLDAVDVSGLRVNLDRKAEWAQIYAESWRQMRDFFYVANMHGVDWPAVRKKYEPLVPFINHRADLTYVIGEMISELNAGHAYVGGGELPAVERIPMGLLGAEFERDAATGFFKITRILPGDNWDKARRSPLTEIGVDVKVGDYLVAVDGKPTSGMATPQQALVGTAGKLVALKVNKEPKAEGAKEVLVTPIADESELRYQEWVKANREKVEKATGGRVGYLHVPDMLTTGLNEFARQFYPQIRKEAMIIDMRGNGGGNVSPQLIERFRREMLMIEIARNTIPSPEPSQMVLGPKVCLLNEYSASDGDLFPYQFRQARLGKLIGKRSWGGVVGIRGTLPLLDGGTLNRPEFSRYDVEGKEWVIEGKGVPPDIEVDNDPAEELAGKDAQLDKAIEVILEELKKNPVKLPPPPPEPKK